MRKYHTRPRKSRSDAQKVHARNLTVLRMQKRAGNVSGDTLNGVSGAESGPAVAHMAPNASTQATQLKQELHRTKRELKNSRQREKRAKANLAQQSTELAGIHNALAEQEQSTKAVEEQLEKQTNEANEEIEELQKTCNSLAQTGDRFFQLFEEEQDAHHQLQARISATQSDSETAHLAVMETQMKLNQLHARNNQLRRSQNALQKRLSRARVKIETFDSSSNPNTEGSIRQLSLKDPKGTIRTEVRDLLRQLAGDGVATENIMGVITHVVETFGLTLTDSVSARSVSRSVLEGLLQSQIQIAVEIDGAERLSICGDGTTIKNQTYEARLLHVPAHTTPGSSQSMSPGPPPLRTLGVHQAPSHTAQSQLNGWKESIEKCCNLLRQAPLGQQTLVNSQHFASKLGGMLTDHAADQKRLAELMRQWKIQSDLELRGREVLDQMSTEEQAEALAEHLEEAKKSVPNWENLSSNDQDQLTHNAWLALALAMGEQAFSQLPGSKKESATFFAWTGCCMHKELNATKGGVASMSAEWKKLGLKPPIELLNTFQAAKSTNTTQAVSLSGQVSGGAVKITTLAGLLFNHRDDKRGQQDTYRYWFEHTLGRLPTFPDTSNTRYGSHSDAAAELLVHRDHYLKFLESVRDAKATGEFVNMEKNIYSGLQDPATLTELAVLALYSQAISKPYMRHVRGSHQNALELGLYHDGVKKHCFAIQQNPYLLMAPSTGALDQGEWERPSVIMAVNNMSKSLPHLFKMLAAFFRGALGTWERFTQEFEPDGTLAQASADARSGIWNNPTNDASEGALGQARQMTRRMPAITDHQRNGRVMWSKNNTHKFVQDHFTQEDHAFVRHKARKIDASGEAKQIRTRQNEAFNQRVQENRARRAKAQIRKSARQLELAGARLLVNSTREDLEKLTVRDLDRQIDKLRETDQSIPAKSKLRNKAAKVAAVQAGLESYVSSRGGISEKDADNDDFIEDEAEGKFEEDIASSMGKGKLSGLGDEMLPDEYDLEWEY